MKNKPFLEGAAAARSYQTQRRLGVPQNRFLHIKQVVRHFGDLCEGRDRAFFSALSPENRKMETRGDYTGHIQWLRSLLFDFSAQEMTDLETGVRLHDIGYAITPGGDHPEAGYQLLHGEGGNTIWEKLNLPPAIDRSFVEMVVRYHGFFTDIGFLFPSQMIGSFTPKQQAALMIMSALDSTAKPMGAGFHSLLFSRILGRYRKLIEGHLPSPESRLQHLFGPVNFIWFRDNDLAIIRKSAKEEGLEENRGYARLLSGGCFLGWPLLKDLVTPEIAFSSSYFTPLKSEYAKHFSRFMAILSQLVEKAMLSGQKIVFDVPHWYMDFANRPQFIARLREALAQPEAEIEQIDAGIYCYREGIFFKLVPNGGSGEKIVIDAGK